MTVIQRFTMRMDGFENLLSVEIERARNVNHISCIVREWSTWSVVNLDENQKDVVLMKAATLWDDYWVTNDVKCAKKWRGFYKT